MNKSELAAYMFAMLVSMNSEYSNLNELTLDEMLIATNEKIMNITLGLTFEIRELVDKGYSYEEIYDLIQNIKFNEEEKLSEREALYIKKDAKKTLKLMIYNKEKEKNENE